MVRNPLVVLSQVDVGLVLRSAHSLDDDVCTELLLRLYETNEAVRKELSAKIPGQQSRLPVGVLFSAPEPGRENHKAHHDMITKRDLTICRWNRVQFAELAEERNVGKSEVT